jgi:lipid-A-disaccharide synthase
MKYYLIAGEASGDLHASHLMQALKQRDAEAEFRFFGGDMMAAVGGTMVKHYRELAYMGFVPVLLHLRTILRNMKMCKEDIREWQPDAVILVDYPGFNLSIAKTVHQFKVQSSKPQIFYYISPKIWAWKEYRIKNIKRDVDELFSILPFEVEFFEDKHDYPIHYVGNPTAQEVAAFKEKAMVGNDDFLRHNGILAPHKHLIAVLCGSRKQEIKDNLPAMLQAADTLGDDYQVVVAGAPSIEHEYYEQFTKGHKVTVLHAGGTYQLLYNATAALVTSGTATLETCLFRVPQVVCYETPLPQLIGFLKRHVLSVRWVSLVNLIAGREVVTELVAETFSAENIRRELMAILPGGEKRQQMLDDYDTVSRILGESHAPDRTAELMISKLTTTKDN